MASRFRRGQGPARWRLVMLLLACGQVGARAQILDYVVRPSSAGSATSSVVTLRWPYQADSTAYEVSRLAANGLTWGSPTPLPAGATNYIDTTYVPGRTREYRIAKYGRGDGEAYIRVGYGLPLVERRGTALLLVDRSLLPDLALELRRFELDLMGDGWTVVRREVARASVDPGDLTASAGQRRLQELAAIKSAIQSVHTSAQGPVRTVVLLGHVPVPYSGDTYPDGHPDHRGAWPCDAYYGDLNGVWGDSLVQSSTASSPRNRNTPGDGKFDETQIPSLLEFEVGRVDLGNLPTVGEERALLRRYLGKNHDFRHGLRTAERRGVIEDRFGLATGEPFAATAWNAFSTFFGDSNVVTGTLVPTSDAPGVLWGFGAAGGTYTSASGVITTSAMATRSPVAEFLLLFGSYFGDWDTPDNLLRAVLGSPDRGLVTAWSGRPSWQFHPMALGETVGYCARLNQNNTQYEQGFARFVTVGLMGDPTLRLHVVPPPAQLAIQAVAPGEFRLTWEPSGSAVDGYAVYRARALGQAFVRLNPGLVLATEFTDRPDPTATNACYLVRAIRTETSASGTYTNASQGVFQDLAGSFGPPRLDVEREAAGVRLGWSANAVDYVLETAPELAAGSWTRATNGLALSGDRVTVQFDRGSPAKFFRLSRRSAR